MYVTSVASTGARRTIRTSAAFVRPTAMAAPITTRKPRKSLPPL